jgi:PST family polysaccharide transporter
MAQEFHPSATAPPAEAHASEPQTITSRTIASGFAWVVLVSYSNRLIGLVTTLVLARLLAPAEFGIVAIASMLNEVLNLFRDMGFSEALIYQKREDRAAVETANTLLVGSNVVFFLLAALVAPWVAEFYDSPILVPVIIVMSSNLVWNSASAIPRALIRKRVEFRRLVVPEVVPVAISGVLSIWMAFAGFGVWSLVAKTVVHSMLSMVLLRRLQGHSLGFGYDAEAARELFQYGKFVVSTSVLLVVLYNIDRFYVSKVVGLAALGFFEVAMRLAELPVRQFAFMVGSVMFPVLTKLDRTDGSMGRAVLKTLRYAAIVSVPMAMAIATYGPAVVATIYGARWAGMIAPLQVLAFFGMIQSLSSLIHDGFKAHGRPDLMQRAVFIRLVSIGVLGIPVLSAFGLIGICWLILATYVGTFLIEMRMLAGLVRVGYAASLSFLTRPLLVSTAVIPGTYWLLAGQAGQAPIWRVVLAIVVAGGAYLLSVYRFDRDAVLDLTRVVRTPRPHAQARVVVGRP